MYRLNAITTCLVITTLNLFWSASAQSNNSTLVVSQDGSCGGSTGQTCLGSTFGNCCSQKGYCGGTADYCSKNCQSAFGSCPSGNVSTVSIDGFCGSGDPNHQMCIGSQWGPCCSGKGYCGKDAVYCSTGCQSEYGSCGGGNLTSPAPANTTSSATSSTASSSSTGSAAPQQITSATPQPAPVTESVGFKAGMGVLGGIVGLALIGLIAFILRRRQQKKNRMPPMYDETKRFTEVSSDTQIVPNTSHGQNSTYKSTPPPPLRKPYEMESAAHSRHELDPKGTAAVEMSSERY